MTAPIRNLTFSFDEPYAVLFLQGPRWVVAPFATYEEAEQHADYLAAKWTATQVTILRNVKVPGDG